MPSDFIKESQLWGPLFALGVLIAVLLMASIVQFVFQLILRNRERVAPADLGTQIITTIRGPVALFVVILGQRTAEQRHGTCRFD